MEHQLMYTTLALFGDGRTICEVLDGSDVIVGKNGKQSLAAVRFRSHLVGKYLGYRDWPTTCS